MEKANETLSIDPDTEGRYPVSTVLTITCGDIYYQAGPINRTCQADGTWSDQSPVCEGKNDYNGIRTASYKGKC